MLNHSLVRSFSPKQTEEWTNLRPVGAVLALHTGFSTLIRSYLVSVSVDVAILPKTAVLCRVLSAEYSFVQRQLKTRTNPEKHAWKPCVAPTAPGKKSL